MTTPGFSPPLRIVLCCSSPLEKKKEKKGKKPAAPWGATTAGAVELALFGDLTEDGEERWEPLGVASAVPLGDDVELRSFTTPRGLPSQAGTFLDEALHTLLVIFVDGELLAKKDFLDWLAACARDPGMASGRHAFLPVLRGEETRDRWLGLDGYEVFRKFQARLFSSLGEDAERVDWLALVLLKEARQLAAYGVDRKRSKLKLFVSHAKHDGLALAKSLNRLLDGVEWLEKFYDVESLSSFRPWESQLEEAVATSIVVALRTDIYDQRPYCQKEVMWAEQYGSPLVLVDARGGLVHAGMGLPFEAAPCVRIPDGNLVRVLHVVLRVSLRSQAFLRRVTELQRLGVLPEGAAIRVIPVTPGMPALLAACEALQGRRGVICYPDPKLPKGRLEAAKAWAATVEAELVTPAERLLAAEAAP
ncbi:MAG TPA: toll/interleukin-1 receptor domain-containing protein [Thermoanaerobaculia bacterium]|nr:toll/interleukin-1 receptor domain-containing protein [Thermoanaerobaculia bacterium]